MNRNRLLSLILALVLVLASLTVAVAEGEYEAPEEAVEVLAEEFDEVEAIDADEIVAESEEDALYLNDEIEFELGADPALVEAEETDEDETIAKATEEASEGAVYALVNIPFSAFFKAVKASSDKVDAVTTATNKVGNYGKAGGAFHSVATASIAEDGTVTAVGGDNGAKIEGVIWAVQADSLEAIEALGGEAITDDSTVTVATLGKGSTSSTKLTGYQSLMEAPAYSYYVLTEAPASYLVLADGSFTASTKAETKSSIEVPVSYGGHHADVTLNTSAAKDISDKLIDLAVLTTDSGDTALVPMYQVWAASEIGWDYKTLDSLTGKTITNIRFYCMVKDGKEYANYVYDYPVNVFVGPMLTADDVTASFASASTIAVSGIPEDAKNVKAQVSYSAGRGSTPEYLTDGAVDVVDGKIALSAIPEEGKTYTVALTADNYGFSGVSASFTFSGYALMNIPFSAFFKAVNASSDKVDAVTTATNKVGNYGKAGGAFHSVATASIAEDGTVTAVGGANGAKIEGVIWAVQADSLKDIVALGGNAITDDSTVTVATLGKGSTSKTELKGYQSLMEAPAYSYYLLSEAPASYLVLSNGSFTAATKAETKGSIEVPVSYGGHHADVTLNTSAAKDISDKLIDLAVLTTDSGDTALVPMYQVWAATEIGWDYKTLDLAGKTITNIRFYCMVKNGKAYANYVYDYPVNVFVGAMLTADDVTASIPTPSTLLVNGIPADAKNVKAQVSYSAGRGSTPEYLTDGAVAVVDGKVALTGTPEEGKTYTVALTADNYGFSGITATYAPDTIVVSRNMKANVYLGKTYQIVLANGTVKSFKASGKGATVTDAGLVMPVKVGTVKVKVECAKPRKYYTVTLKVIDPSIPTAISFDEKKVSVRMGETITLEPVILPATANQTVTWKTSNKRVATVDENGVVTPLKPGKVRIYATTTNKKRASITVTVTP